MNLCTKIWTKTTNAGGQTDPHIRSENPIFGFEYQALAKNQEKKLFQKNNQIVYGGRKRYVPSCINELLTTSVISLA